MKKYVVILFLLFSTISLFSIKPPNPDDCIECDSVPWIYGQLSFPYTYTDVNGNQATCNISVGYGYKVCNGEIECYIDRLFAPPGGCYTEVRNKPGFYERCENELTIELCLLLNIPSNGSSYTFNHWRPGSCSFLCWNTDYSYGDPIMTAQIYPCDDGYTCCIEEIVATRDINGGLTTDFNFVSTGQTCPLQVSDEIPEEINSDIFLDCEYWGDCIIECR